MPVFAQWLLAAVISMALSFLLRPKAPTSPATALAEPPGDAEMPTVTEGKEIHVLFGVGWVGDSTVVWWGDTKIDTRTYEERVSA